MANNISLSNLPSTVGRRHRRVGRGNSSGRGKTAGRGMKGQRSRSGSKRGLKLRGLKQSIMKLPKLRGFRSIKKPLAEVSLSSLEKNFNNGETVTLGLLKKKGLIDQNSLGTKILGSGALNKKLKIKTQACSASARKIIEAAGGEVITEIKTDNKTE
jgi:large subunit ribosomal protein L15